MRPTPPANDTFRCPGCGEESFRFAPICHACGRVFNDGDKVGDGGDQVESRHSRAWQWEPLLGVGLLLLVIGFALFFWIAGTLQSNAYHEGVAAEERRDWDVAVARFKDAGDHPGAQSRLAAAARTRDERDSLYREGIEAISKRQWSIALDSLRAVEEIQPGYRDTGGLMAQAEVGAEKTGAAGIVYLVTDGPQPGLYRIDETGHSTHLPGSDGQSRVRAVSAESDAIAYDRPVLPGEGSSGDANRRERWVTVTWDGGSAVPLPTLDPNGKGVFSRDGLWWHSSPRGESMAETEVNNALLYYSPYKSGCAPHCVTLVSTQAGVERIVALDPPRSRTLLAVTLNAPGRVEHRTSIYLADALGDNRQFLDDVEGDIHSASFSPDGRWLLYASQLEGPTVTRRMWLIRLPDGLGTRSGDRIRQLGFLMWPKGDTSASLTAHFLYSRHGQTLLAVSRRVGVTERLSVSSLEEGQSPNKDGYGWPSDSFQTLTRFVELVELDNVPGAEATAFARIAPLLASAKREDGERQIVLYGTLGETRLRYSVPLSFAGDAPVELVFSPHDDYLVVIAHNAKKTPEAATQTIHTSRLGEAWRPEKLLPFTTANLSPRPDLPTVTLPSIGAHLVYVNPAGQLRAARYDGEKDILLAEGVAAVWDLNAGPDGTWQR